MNKKGFVALLAVIFISAALSVTVIGVSLKARLVQSSVSMFQSKQDSRLSAVSCVTVVILLLAEFGEVEIEDIRVAGVPDCKVHSIKTEGVYKIIEVWSNIQKNYTFLRATINTFSKRVILLEEVSGFE